MVQTEPGHCRRASQREKERNQGPRSQERVNRPVNKKDHIARMAGLCREEKMGERAQLSLWAGEFRVGVGHASPDVSVTVTGAAARDWRTVSAVSQV